MIDIYVLEDNVNQQFRIERMIDELLMKISGTIVILKYLVSRLIFQILLRNLAHKFFLRY